MGGGHAIGARGMNTGGGASRPPMIAEGIPMHAPQMLEQIERIPPHKAKGEGGPQVGGAQVGGGHGAYDGGGQTGGPPAAAGHTSALAAHSRHSTIAKTLVTIPHPPLVQILQIMLEGVKLERRTLNIEPWSASLTRGFNMGVRTCQAKILIARSYNESVCMS